MVLRTPVHYGFIDPLPSGVTTDISGTELTTTEDAK